MDLLIFDLDGTLIDSKLDLVQAVNATRRHLGRTELDHDTVYSYVGNGAPVLIRRTLGPETSQPEVEEGLRYFLQYYRSHPVDHTVLYPGITAALEKYQSAGIRMAVLTNKPVNISNVILKALGVDHFFHRVYGGDSFEQKKPHPIGIETLMAECGVSPANTLMVGDSAVDIQTARNAGVLSCGVMYGFQPETIAPESPDLIVDDIDGLTRYLFGDEPRLQAETDSKSSAKAGKNCGSD